MNLIADMIKIAEIESGGIYVDEWVVWIGLGLLIYLCLK